MDDFYIGELFDKDSLIKRAEYFTYKLKDGMYYNDQIKEMCTLFINIGLRDIIPEQLVDISYEAYINYKNDEKKLVMEKK